MILQNLLEDRSEAQVRLVYPPNLFVILYKKSLCEVKTIKV